MKKPGLFLGCVLSIYFTFGAAVPPAFAGTDPTLSITNSPTMYRGSPQAATIAASADGIVSNIRYTGSSTIPTDAGIYAVIADFVPSDTDTYNSLTDASLGDFTIAQATSTTVVSCPNSVVYNGSPQTPCSATYTTSDGLSGSAAISYSNNTDVDNALVSASYDGDSNHVSSAASTGFNITKADAVINVSGFTGTYDGLAHGATGTAVGVESSPADLNNYLHLGSSFTNPPGGTVNWTFDASRNYKAASGSVSIVINIDPLATSTILTTTTNADLSVSADPINATSLTASTSAGTITVDLPSGLTITGPAGWDGTLSLPAVTTSYASPQLPEGVLAVIGLAIEVGSSTAPLTFDKGVRLLFPGKGDNRVGWSREGTFTEITQDCTADTQAVGDELPAAGNCQIPVGRDLVVWTKHFTSFVTFLARTSNGSTGSGGGAIAVASSGGGGGGGTSQAVAVTNTGAVSTGQVLGAATYNFTKDLQMGSTGTDVTELQKVLIAEGFDIPAITKGGLPYGTFGGQTLSAVIAYQKAHGISPASGYVRTLTRAALNKGVVATGAESVGKSALSAAQVDSIVGVLQSFGADAATIAKVRAALGK